MKSPAASTTCQQLEGGGRTDVQRHRQLRSRLFVPQRLRHQWLLVVDHRPRPLTVPHIHGEVSGCLSVLPDWPLSLSGGVDKHQDASALEPLTPPVCLLVCLRVSSHFLFGRFGSF